MCCKCSQARFPTSGYPGLREPTTTIGILYADDVGLEKGALSTYSILNGPGIDRNKTFLIYGRDDVFAKTMRISRLKNVLLIGGKKHYWKIFHFFENAKCVPSRQGHPCGYVYSAWDCYVTRDAPEGAVPMPHFCQASIQRRHYAWHQMLWPGCNGKLKEHDACFHGSAVTDMSDYL